MAIVRRLPDIDPKELAEGQMVLVDSDARSDAHAMLEVEDWCRDNGLMRAWEGRLQMVRMPDGEAVRRVRCYRPYAEELAQYERDYRAMDERVARMPMTVSSVELSREG